MNKMYYGPKNTTSDDYRISPIPQINISRDINYANDIIIGYAYTITLNGVVSNYRDLRNNKNDTTDYNTGNGIKKVFQNIEILRKILTRNGSFLRLISESNKVLLEANGGTLRSLTFDESDNRWTNTTPFTAVIEFNELYILGETENGIHFSSITSNIIDINKYKIKDYSESWTFDLVDNEYNDLSYISAGVENNNSRIGINYNISATGKNYFNNDGKTKAAWNNAKDFVQERLYHQLTNLISGILFVTGDNNFLCEATKVLGNKNSNILVNNSEQIHYNDVTQGLLNEIKRYYKIYNENISCDTSESEGTFSCTYKGILKQKYLSATDFNNVSELIEFADTNKDGVLSDGELVDILETINQTTRNLDVIHTISKKINYNLNNTDNKIITININGNIKGLVEGKFLFGYGNFTLPKTGSLIIANSNNISYNSAENFLYAQIYDPNKNDLTTALKQYLDISTIFNETTLDCTNSVITPVSINLTKNHFDGTIDYSVEYNSTKIRTDTGVLSSSPDQYWVVFTTFDFEESTPVYADFITPNKHIVQFINTSRPKRLTINIEGRLASFRKCCQSFDIDTLIGGFGTAIETIPDFTSYILTGRQTNINPIEGSFTITENYIMRKGCFI